MHSKMQYNISGNAEDNDEKVGIKCPICFATINDSLLLEQHLALSHAKDVTYKCGICSFVCQYHGDYLNHMKTHFSGPPFKCDYCKSKLKDVFFTTFFSAILFCKYIGCYISFIEYQLLI